MVAGHLTLKNGRYYAVLNYRNAGGQRKTKWIALGLLEKGNKRKAEAELARLRAEFEPPKEVGDLSCDMLFADYLLEWLEIAKGRLAVATYSSYAAMIKKPVGPYFRQRNLTLRDVYKRQIYNRLTSLVNGETFTTFIDTGVIYPQIKSNPSTIYSFLLVTGYLKDVYKRQYVEYPPA